MWMGKVWAGAKHGGRCLRQQEQVSDGERSHPAGPFFMPVNVNHEIGPTPYPPPPASTCTTQKARKHANSGAVIPSMAMTAGVAPPPPPPVSEEIIW